MLTLFEESSRQSVLERVRRLKPDSRPGWGRMDASAMVCHVICGLQQALGEIAPSPPGGPMARWPVNWLAVHVLPWPKGRAVSPPELLVRAPGAWESDIERLVDLIERFGARGPTGTWPVSPVFGSLSAQSWGVLQYRHVDHHLQQFRV